MKNFFIKTIIATCLTAGTSTLSYAQERVETPQAEGNKIEVEEKEHKKAWEIGIGGTAFEMTRFGVLDFKRNAQDGLFINTSKKDLIFGGNIYLARELSKHFYIDFQGSLGYTSDPIKNDEKESRWLGMAGLGLQWRLGEYFNSKYIDPYFRVGANYMHKSFDIFYNGVENLDESELKWLLKNDYNKDGSDRRNLIPISGGAGVNMWLNDRFGIGLQADYLVMPYKNVANAWQGTARIMWRLGGKSKKTAPQTHYVERVVERVIEKPVEKIVEVEKLVPAPAIENSICDMFSNVDFDFDKATITPESEKVIDEIANIMIENQQYKYLVVGSTDALGSAEYNLDLSQRRAKAVIDALIKRGVPESIVKSRGIGKKTAYAPESASDNIRRGDRKVYVEIIRNLDYWNYLK